MLKGIAAITAILPNLLKLITSIIKCTIPEKHNIDSPYHFLKQCNGKVYCIYLGENGNNLYYCLRYHELIPDSFDTQYYDPHQKALTKLEFTIPCSLNDAGNCDLFAIPNTRSELMKG